MDSVKDWRRDVSWVGEFWFREGKQPCKQCHTRVAEIVLLFYGNIGNINVIFPAEVRTTMIISFFRFD